MHGSEDMSQPVIDRITKARNEGIADLTILQKRCEDLQREHQGYEIALALVKKHKTG